MALNPVTIVNVLLFHYIITDLMIWLDSKLQRINRLYRLRIIDRRVLSCSFMGVYVPNMSKYIQINSICDASADHWPGVKWLSLTMHGIFWLFANTVTFNPSVQNLVKNLKIQDVFATRELVAKLIGLSTNWPMKLMKLISFYSSHVKAGISSIQTYFSTAFLRFFSFCVCIFSSANMNTYHTTAQHTLDIQPSDNTCTTHTW